MQEYLASVIGTYYGLWDLYGGGMWGIYAEIRREELAAIDAKGLDVVERFFSPRLTWMVYLSPELGAGMTFQLDFEESKGASNPKHAYKSRYMDHVNLLGGNNRNMQGNANDDCFRVNAGNNVVDGKEGSLDALMLRGSRTDYTWNEDKSTVTDGVKGRDGITRPLNIDVVSYFDFADVWSSEEEGSLNYRDQVIKCRDLVGVDWAGEVEEGVEEGEEGDGEEEGIDFTQDGSAATTPTKSQHLITWSL